MEFEFLLVDFLFSGFFIFGNLGLLNPTCMHGSLVLYALEVGVSVPDCSLVVPIFLKIGFLDD